MLGFLDNLEMQADTSISVFLPAGMGEDAAVRDVLGAALSSGLPADIAESAAASPTGSVLFRQASTLLLIRPPFPLKEHFIAPGCDTGPLRSLLEHPFAVALVLVRLGAFAIGVWRGQELVASKTGTGLVHGRHRKGGQSQRRFERRREKQAGDFLERVCGHAREQMEPFAQMLDHLAYGGARAAISTLRKQCPFLEQFQDRLLPPLLNIPRPRRAVLDTAFADLCSSSITEWQTQGLAGFDSPPPGA